MSPASVPGSARWPISGGARWAAILPILTVLLMVAPAGTVPAGTAAHGTAHPSSFPIPSAARGLTSPALAAPGGARAAAPVHPASAAFSPPCYPVATGVCVSIANPGSSDIVPQGSNRTSSVMPDCSQNIYLVVKSHVPLNASGGTSPTSGPHSPIALNVTGILWNGDPYYSKYDNSIWHANSRLWWVLIGQENNKTYPWWYNVTIFGKNAGNQLNFFPGMQVTWWIFLTTEISSSNYVSTEGPHLTYTCAGAWPYSPYPGAPHYGGPASTFLDTNITVLPRSPNWNDTVSVTVNTTQADVAPYNATIGKATLDVIEVSHGSVLVNTSWSFNVSVLPNGFGDTTVTTRIPSSYAQIAGATISFRVWVSDTSPIQDWLVTPWTNYTVNGNGTFATGVFTEDLTLLTDPQSVLIDASGTAQLTPGQPLGIVVTSRNAPNAILAVQVLYTVAYPALHETIRQTLELNRISSIVFAGKIPALPVDTIVNFTVLAWDFTDAIEQSSLYSYSVMTLDEYVGPVPAGLAFFYVLVYDNGSQTWVQGADVQITGPNGIFNSVSNTTLGVAYANQSGTPFTPLLLQANATYNVTVRDDRFVPGGGNAGPNGPVSVEVKAVNPMTTDRALASTANYIVLQQGNQILFYLNATAPPLQASPSVSQGSAWGDLGVAAAVGLIAASVAMIPLLMWWRQIKARRTIEEKRVTL